MDHWDASWPATEPRTPNWNCSAASRSGHHGVIATQPVIDDAAALVVTDVFKNRWRTLMSVDDVIDAVVKACEEQVWWALLSRIWGKVGRERPPAYQRPAV